MNTATYVESMWQDILYAFRMMRKSPVFTLTAVLTLAVGIAGNTAMFTVIRAVLLKPLEYRDPDRLVRLSVDNPRRNSQDGRFTLMEFEQMRAAARSFTGVGAFLLSPEDVTLSGAGEPECLKSARVSANFLDILGLQPVVGRSFLPEEDRPGGPPVAMISAELWRRRYSGDPEIAGKTATLNSMPYTIIGVLPAGFEFPFPGIDVWVTRPSEWSALPPRYWRILSLLIGVARLNPQVTLEQARTELYVLHRQYLASHPPMGGADPSERIGVTLLKDRLVANVRPMLWMLLGAVGFVLLIGCANVASLLLARGASRLRELAVRSAVGASRGRLIRQLLAESLLLAAAGGGFGVLLAKSALNTITYVSALDLPRVGEIRLDGMVLGFTAALSMATGILFGLFPALEISRPDLAAALRESGAAAGRGLSGKRRAFGASRLRPNARGMLVVGQVALSIVLLIGATLLMKSFARLRSVDPGFRPSNLLTMRIPLPPARYDTDQKKTAFFNELVRRVEAVPGVRAAATALFLPTTGADVLERGQATDAGPEFYVPSIVHPPQTAYLAVRTERDPLRFVHAIQSQVAAIDRDQPVSDIRTMDEVMERTLGQRRLTMWLLGLFAGAALLLAVIGIYGVIAYSVAQRTQEVGIRRALGAQHDDILRLVLKQGLSLAVAGVGAGMCGAFVLTRMLKSLLFQVSATDPATFLSVGLLFVTVALVASFFPAWRATRIDPMTALRVG